MNNLKIGVIVLKLSTSHRQSTHFYDNGIAKFVVGVIRTSVVCDGGGGLFWYEDI